MWLKSPDQSEAEPIIPLKRAKFNQPVGGELTGNPLRCFVHYAAGRSWPCTGHKCCLCKRGIGKRCYAYYPIMGKKGGVAILELTSLAEASLIKQMGPATDTPHGKVTVSRPPGRRNLPCDVQWTESENNKKSGGYPMDHSELAATLMRIWKLPSRNGQQEEKEYLETLNEAIRLRTTNHK